MIQRSANFDVLRLMASLMVLWSHQFAVTGMSERGLPWSGTSASTAASTWGGLGVLIFFAISGYLNAQSLFRSRSASAFLLSRAARIFPALAVCAGFCVLLGAAVTTRHMADYLWPDIGLFGRDAPLSFLWRNSTLLFGLDFALPGVFESNTYPKAVNGSLWTLPYEVKLYLLLALVVACFRFDARVFAAIVVATLAGALLYGFVQPLGAAIAGKYLATFAVVFIGGAGLAMVEQAWGRVRAVVLFAVLALGFGLSGDGATALLLAVPVVCVLLNQVAWPDRLAPKYDISYGVYLYAFPVQQLTSNLSDSFWLRLAAVVVIVVALGILSARLVEQPALRWRRSLGRTPVSRNVA